MKKMSRSIVIFLSLFLCLSTIACSLTSEDVEKISTVISVINEFESNYSGESTYEEEKEALASALSSAVKVEEVEKEPEVSVERKEIIEEQAEEKTEVIDYHFRSKNLLKQHYEKHGIEMGFESKEAYEEAASAVVNNPAALHKQEKEDNDDVYYIEETNEFVIVSTDGYIRTYFLPNAGIDYYNRQ